MTLPHYIKVISRRVFMFGASVLAIGLYLGFSGGFDNLAYTLVWGGVAGVVLGGAFWLLFRDADSHLR